MLTSDALDVLTLDSVRGDGEHDDAAGIQEALNQARVVYLPHTPQGYLIASTLKLGSGQTLIADPQATIRMADHAHAHMVENSDQAAAEGAWQEGITVIGGIWDGNNEHQTCYYHETARYEEGFYGDGQRAYDPDEYLGMIFQFDRVRRLTIRGCTLKDPEMFAVQIGNVEDFLIEDIDFDFNMATFNMDGIHVHGNSRRGLIRNIRGSTNDDMIALNADDGPLCEIARGPIEDIVVDGIFAGDRCLTGVRLLSCGSDVRRIRISNVFGRFMCSGVYFSHHNVHPGERSLFEDIAIDGLWFTRCRERVTPSIPQHVEDRYPRDPVWVAPTTRVTSLTIRNLHRREEAEDACPGTIRLHEGALVDFLDISASSIVNTGGSIGLLENAGGEIGHLSISGAHVESAQAGGAYVVRNDGAIRSRAVTGTWASP